MPSKQPSLLGVLVSVDMALFESLPTYTLSHVSWLICYLSYSFTDELLEHKDFVPHWALKILTKKASSHHR